MIGKQLGPYQVLSKLGEGGMAGGRWQISNSGGRKPLWNRKGGELFYVSGNGAMMAVPVESGRATTTSAARPASAAPSMRHPTASVS